jgi:dipeptidyl aminopeptidase/acylaminoacyl peptidase
MAIPSARALVNSQVAIESFDLSPDGAWVVYASRTVSRGAYRSHLWAVPWEGGRARRLTSGPVRDSVPSIGAKGMVAFVRSPADEVRSGTSPLSPDREPQIWVVPLTGGDPRQVTHLPHGAGSHEWSRDADRLALLAQAGPHRFAVGPERPGRSITARRMTRTDFRDDESGLLSRRTHLWVMSSRQGARPVQVTHGDFDVAHPAWAPDGDWLAFSADMGPDANIAPRATLHRVAVGGGEVSPLAELRGAAHHPAVSRDGKWVAFLGKDVDDAPEHFPWKLWLVPAEGGTPRCLTRTLDRSIHCDTWADLVMAEDREGPVWLSEGEIGVIVATEGRNIPYRVSLAGENRQLLAPGRVVGAGLRAAAGRIGLSAGADRRGAEVYALEGAGKRVTARRRALTTEGSAWQRRFPLPRWDELSVPTPRGPMQVWVASPAGASTRPMPTILELHGGPDGARGPGGTMDATFLAGHGYRVVMPNPRGSATFGTAWADALRGHWGELDTDDVHAALDDVIARGLTDPDRIGVMGISYGGFLAQWLIGVSDRFRAAVGENGVSNQVSAWANSYFGVHYNRRWKLGDPLSRAGMLRLWRSSPLANVARIQTPLLILQSEEDLICPASDNEQLFVALRALGRETELILYPEEHHEMKSDGRPDRRIDRMERILAWFDRWVRELPA